MNPLISVIVPVYNVERYLEQCVESILNQTYQDIEVILVDDGSTDGSGEICDRYARTDSRVKVIHKENGGLSSARNRGIEAASGDRLVFVDSDDCWANNDLLRTAVDLKNENNDNLILWKFQRCAENEIIPYVPIAGTLQYDLTKDYHSLLRTGTLFASACYLAIPAQWFLNGELRFEEGKKSEDVEWFFRVLEKTKDISLIDAPVYIYRCREESLSNTSLRKSVQDMRSHILRMTEKFSELPDGVLKAFIGEQTANYVIILSRYKENEKELAQSKPLIRYLKYAVRKRSRAIYICCSVFGLKNTLRLLNLADTLVK